MYKHSVTCRSSGSNAFHLRSYCRQRYDAGLSLTPYVAAMSRFAGSSADSSHAECDLFANSS